MMKKYLIIFSLIGICFSQKSYNEKHLVEQNGIWYKKFSDEVVNGNIFMEIDGMKAPLGKIKNGKKDGKWIIWNSDGTKLEEQYFFNGVKEGKWKTYSKNGNVKQITTFVNDKIEDKVKYNDDGSLIEIDEVCIETKFGVITLQLFKSLAPKHVESFKLHAQNGYYDGTTFHRVIPGFMIQGGDPLTRNDEKRNLHGTGGNPAKYFGIGDELDKKTWGIPQEFNSTPHDRGILSMARSMNENSAGSQFFICVDNARFLDNQYTVFGKVVNGMNIVDTIVNLPRDARDNPNEKVEMKFISCQ